MRRESDACHVPLARLGREDAELLVAALANPELRAPGLAERLHRESEGNPFFLLSILQSLMEGETREQPHANAAMLPDALRAAVRVRLAHVPKELRPILETAAVLGRRFYFDTLLDVTREPEDRLLDAVEALVKRRLLREEPEGGIYDFSHDKLREVVYADIGGARRRWLHQSVAEALERRSDGEPHERNAQPGAGHWLARKDKAGEWALVRVAKPFGTPPAPVEGQLEKTGPDPDSSSASMPGFVQPWAVG